MALRSLLGRIGIELPIFEACNLGIDECGAVLKILRAMLRPELEPSVVGRQRGEMRWALVGRTGGAAERSSQRAIEVIFGLVQR